MEADLEPPTNDFHDYDDGGSNCSTPFVSAPSSPGRSFRYPTGAGFFYSAPASPMHYILSSSAASLTPSASDASSAASFEFEFSARFDSPLPEITLADELFLNGQIRPMKLSAHLQRPQTLAPLLDLAERSENDDDDDDDVFRRSRDLKLRDRSVRRRARSLSPLRTTAPFDWLSPSDDVVSTPKKEEVENVKEAETTASGSSSRCSSAGRSSKRWIFLKDFLRSKSEGRSNHKFWHNINTSFSPAKDKKPSAKKTAPAKTSSGKRRSAHEMHYTANRAQAEEMRKKTFLPYRQGLLGCLGFNSKSYGALHGFARALNPVSSR